MTVNINIPEDLLPEVEYQKVVENVSLEELVTNAVLTYLVLLRETQRGNKLILREPESKPYEWELELSRRIK